MSSPVCLLYLSLSLAHDFADFARTPNTILVVVRVVAIAVGVVVGDVVLLPRESFAPVSP